MAKLAWLTLLTLLALEDVEEPLLFRTKLLRARCKALAALSQTLSGGRTIRIRQRARGDMDRLRALGVRMRVLERDTLVSCGSEPIGAEDRVLSLGMRWDWRGSTKLRLRLRLKLRLGVRLVRLERRLTLILGQLLLGQSMRNVVERRWRLPVS